jgi:uncharacterized membrane protein (UPF0136 family)
MKEKAIIIGCYAILILIGGIIGHVVANSLASLIASSLIALILFSCTALIWKGNMAAYHTATVLIASLLAFFTYRFFLTYKLAPGGVMAMISGVLFIYLFMQRKKLVPTTLR